MRHLIDHYIQADDPRQISPFGDVSLMDLIVKTGIADAIGSLPNGIRGNRDAVAETIENNVRSKIIRDHLIDPAFFEEMSTLLAEVIRQRRAQALDYEEYLQRIADIVKRVNEGKQESMPPHLDTPAKRVLYNNLGGDDVKAVAVHETVLQYRADSWRGHTPKENAIKSGLYQVLGNEEEVERVFSIVKQQKEY